MPILSSIAGAAAKAYGMMANAKRIITDTFNRANGSLGTSSSGHPWSVLRGTWSISSNKAASSDSGNTYALATVDIGAQNIVVSADIADGGPGVAFWVTDANSWWASSVNYRNSSYSYTYSGCCGGSVNVSVGSSCTCGSYSCSVYLACYDEYVSGYSCPSGCFYSPSMGQCLYNITEDGCGSGTPIYSTSYCANGYYSCGSTCNSIGCASSGAKITGGSVATCSASIATCSATGTNYYTELKLYKDVSGTISTVATQQINTNTSSYSKVNSIKAITSGDSITVSAYSNAGLSSQLGSNLTNTPVSPIKGSKAGIIKTPTDDNSGSTLDNFSIENLI